MRKLWIAGALLVGIGVVYGAQQGIKSVSAWTPPKLVEQINDEFDKIDDNFDDLYTGVTTNQAFLDGATNLAYLIIVSGRVTAVSPTIE